MFYYLVFVVLYLEHCSFNVKRRKRDEKHSTAVDSLIMKYQSSNMLSVPVVLLSFLFSGLENEGIQAVRSSRVAGVAAVENLGDGGGRVGCHVEGGRGVHLDRRINHFGHSCKQEARVVAERGQVLFLLGRFGGLWRSWRVRIGYLNKSLKDWIDL